MAYYYNAAGQRFPLPERPLEPQSAFMGDAPDEDQLMMMFVQENEDEFVEFVSNFDRTILWDFIESLRWKWRIFKEENR
uniref:Uncharacterized protein n=1 Tax=Dulem virus 33 TaxID=3145751 RepID=A0AAU8B5S2_9CAUD